MHDLSWRLPAAKCADQPSHQLDLLRRGGLWARGLWESSPGRARDPGIGRQTLEPPDPSPAGQQRDKDRPKLRQAGVGVKPGTLGEAASRYRWMRWMESKNNRNDESRSDRRMNICRREKQPTNSHIKKAGKYQPQEKP